MDKKKLKLHARVMWFNTVERWHDFLNITIPIFLVSGLLVACFKFWWWLFGTIL